LIVHRHGFGELVIGIGARYDTTVRTAARGMYDAIAHRDLGDV
jgi:hypothetical protein